MYTQGGTSGYGSESLPSWAHREPRSSESSSHYPVSSEFQSPYQSSRNYGSSSSGYTDAPYSSYYGSESGYGREPGYGYGSSAYSQGGSLPSWAHREPHGIESSRNYPVSSQFQGGGYYGGESGYGREPGYGYGSSEYSQGGPLPSWAHREPRGIESSRNYPVSSQFQGGGYYGRESGYGRESAYGYGYGPESSSGYGGYGGLPSWSREDVGSREHYGSRYQPEPSRERESMSGYGGYGGYSGYSSSSIGSGYGGGHVASWGQQNPQATSLPNWAKVDVAAEEQRRHEQRPGYYQSRPVSGPPTGRQYGPY